MRRRSRRSCRGVTFVGERAERTPGHSLALLEGLNGHALVALLDERGHRRGGRAGLRQRRVEREPGADRDGHLARRRRAARCASASARSARAGTARSRPMPSCAAPRCCGARARSSDAAAGRFRPRGPRRPSPTARASPGGSALRRPRAHHARARRRTARIARRALRRRRLRARDRRRGLGLPAQPGAAVPGRRARVARRVRRRARARRARARVRRRGARRAARGARRRRRARARAAARRRAASPSRCRAASIPRSRCCASAPRRRRGRRPHAAALDRRAGAGRRARLLLARRRRCARARAATRSGSRTSRWTAARPSARAVVEPFVAGYARGETPNPCTTCNGSYRLAALVDAAERLGAPARRDRATTRGSSSATAARSSRAGPMTAKDQSYMLARVPADVLERLRLPLGDATKAAVRAEAAAAGMAAATARESQDVCFLGGGALDDFLAREGVQLTAGQHPRRGRARARAPRGRRRLHAGPAPRPRRRRLPRRSTSCAPTPRRNELVVGPAERASPAARCCCARRASTPARAACTPSCARARPRSPRASSAVRGRPAPAARGAGLRRRRGTDRGALRRRRMRRRIGRHRARCTALLVASLVASRAFRQGEILKFRPTPVR